MKNAITLNASDYTQRDRFYTRHLYCEDPRLSLPKVGVPTKALVVRQGDDVETLSFEDLYEMLGYLSCVYDLSGFEGKAPAQRKAYNQMTTMIGRLELTQ